MIHREKVTCLFHLAVVLIPLLCLRMIVFAFNLIILHFLVWVFLAEEELLQVYRMWEYFQIRIGCQKKMKAWIVLRSILILLQAKNKFLSRLYYYNTYTSLHLLSLWWKLANHCKKSKMTLSTVCNQVMEEQVGLTKVVCRAINRSTDKDPWKEDIILCQSENWERKVHEFFGRVDSVTSMM